jgi:hypothetical protein
MCNSMTNRHKTPALAKADGKGWGEGWGGGMLTVLRVNCVPLSRSCRARRAVFWVDHAKRPRNRAIEPHF